ncbi:MAG: hypothetical protein QGI14_06465, partial [Candidatus Poseidonia sp.]|nr:hypothetical protein [Poseidonia sp.]
PEEREARKREIEAEIEATSRRLDGNSAPDESAPEPEPESELELETKAVEDEANEEVSEPAEDDLPSAPDLDALSEE